VDGDLDSIKLKSPNFQGKNDLEAYLEYEKKVDADKPTKRNHVNPTPRVIMSTTYWRCQFGQSQELGQRSLKKH